MRWPPWRRCSSPAPPKAESHARRELEESDRLLLQAQHDVFTPLREMRQRNNVNELARRLISGDRGDAR